MSVAGGRGTLSTDEADVIIVGAGSAGCVLAERLSADPNTTVLVVEAGGHGRTPNLRIPKGFARVVNDPRYATHYPALLPQAANHTEPWIRGHGVGGSSTINGMVYHRGEAADWDALAARGASGLSWNEALSAYRAMEDHELGAAPSRGVGGPLHICVRPPEGAVPEAALTVGESLGWRSVDDVNAEEGARIGPVPATINDGERVSTASAFLRPALQRPNLRVLTHAQAGHLIFDGERQTRVRGVRVRQHGGQRDLRCRREVILAAGTIESPLLLERSGIGDPRILRALEIPVRVESPNVGEGVIEHRTVPVRARLRPGLGWNATLSTRRGLTHSALRYLLRRDGPLATGPYELAAFLNSGPAASRPDILSLWTAISADPRVDHLRAAPYAALTVTSYPLRPTTTSSVHASGPTPQDTPRITARFLETAADRATSGAILAIVREALATTPLDRLVTEVETPGPELTRAGWRYALGSGGGVYHAVGSCALGPDEGDVVDHQLRVRGVEGLRVVDASVFPEMVSGNTAAPVMALAWRAATAVPSH